ncbi:MAG TPA: preprotein translocase subunit SecE [Acidobacteriaceae bacterium]|jgi:preprotein translocase subunit SecE|nr:preprotein translocase subunit SecE [Acidobacteriaceae bacterium]
MAKSATMARDEKQGGEPGKSVEKANKALKANKASGQGGSSSALSENAVTGAFTRSVDFLKDVRSEMRKVVTPSWKEVRSMTTVVIVTVFAFAAFFYVVDGVLGKIVQTTLHWLGGGQ